MRKVSSWKVVFAFITFAGCGVATIESQPPEPTSASSVEQDVVVDPCHTACRRANTACIRECIHDPGSGGDCGCPEDFAECNASCP